MSREQMGRTFSEVLASECGGAPEDYEGDADELRSLDEAAVDPEEFDMSADGGGLDLDEEELEAAEEIHR